MQDEVISNAKSKIFSFVDEKSFVEIDKLLDESVFCGYATVSSRPVCIFCQDSSVNGGALTENGCEKICKVIDMAIKTGVPLIGFYDSIGAKIDLGTKVLIGIEKVLTKLSDCSGVIPYISVVLGNVTGISTFTLSFSDFVFMIDKESKVFINSPSILTAKTGKDVLAEEIGGAKVHFSRTGLSHFISSDFNQCSSLVKELLEYLPDNNLSDTEICLEDDLNRVCDLIEEDILPRDVIDAILDNGKFLEISKEFGENIITGFGRIGGRTIGLVSNNGTININAIDKATRFVRFCDAFNIPVITLIDCEGFEVSKEEELNGIVRRSAKLLHAYSDATTTKINVIFGKAFGGASIVMGANPDMTLAFNNSKISVLEPKSAVNILYSDDIANAESPVLFREEKLKEYIEKETDPKNALKDGFIDDIILPGEARIRIISALYMFSSKRVNKLVKKHGNMPL